MRGSVANHRRAFHMNPDFFCTFPIFLISLLLVPLLLIMKQGGGASIRCLYTSGRIRRHGREYSESSTKNAPEYCAAMERDSPRKDPHQFGYVVKFCVFK